MRREMQEFEDVVERPKIWPKFRFVFAIEQLVTLLYVGQAIIQIDTSSHDIDHLNTHPEKRAAAGSNHDIESGHTVGELLGAVAFSPADYNELQPERATRGR